MQKKTDYKQKAIKLHEKLRGKISVVSKQKVTKDNLSLLYTPGVAEACKLIATDSDESYNLTSSGIQSQLSPTDQQYLARQYWTIRSYASYGGKINFVQRFWWC
jgi:malic enzyme